MRVVRSISLDPSHGVWGVVDSALNAGATSLWLGKALWEQGLPAIQAIRSFRNRGACFAGKPCSHK
ncbi:hypothetical protein B0E42_25035 [Pseudomonas sp. A25(2017)]|nr:hypothetical protein B0E42_25035 [Pseudomonas sp. A25(2017)]